VKTSGLLRNGWTPLPDQLSTCHRQVTGQNGSEQCTRSSLIPIWVCEPSAEPCKKGVDCLKTGGLLQNGWTALLDRPDTCPGQVTRQNESDHCTGPCLITIQAREPSAAPCKEGVDCLKTGGLLRNGWTPLPDQPGTCSRQVTCAVY
jgi:hypothetical protein